MEKVIEKINELQRKHKYVYFVIRNGNVFYIHEHHRYINLRKAPEQKIGTTVSIPEGKLYLYEQYNSNQKLTKTIKQKTIMAKASSSFKVGDKVIRYAVGSSMGRPGEVVDVTKETGISVLWISGTTSSGVDPEKLALQKDHKEEMANFLAANKSAGKETKAAPAKKETKAAPTAKKKVVKEEEAEPAPKRVSKTDKNVKSKSVKLIPLPKGGKPKPERTVEKETAIEINAEIESYATEKPSKSGAVGKGKVKRPASLKIEE